VANGPTRLLLPGSLCDQRIFRPLIEAWERGSVCPNVRVTDMHATSLGNDAWWTEQLEGCTDQIDLLGFSLGGVLAVNLMRRSPERIRRIALVAFNPMAGNETHVERARAQQQIWLEQGPAAVADAVIEQASPNADDSIRQTIRSMAIDTPTAAFITQGNLNASRSSALPVLAKWATPLLQISAEEDPWCGADKQIMIQQARPNTEWLSVPATGHFIPLECPSVLADATGAFFER
jgi:pimeloyl-ACP methyl ester carboxylesterase